MILTALARLHRWAAFAFLVLVAVLAFPVLTYAASTTDIINMFKYTYGVDRMLYLAAEEIVLWRILSRKKTPVGGRGQWIIPIQKSNAGVWVGNAEGGPKTTRRSQPSSMEATFSLQEFHGVWDVSWKMLQDARKDEYSFSRAIDFMDESFKRRTFREMNADLCGSGLGELGIASAATVAGNDVVCRALPFVDQGMIVDLMDASDNDTKQAAARTVTDIDVVTRTVTLSGAPFSCAAGDYLVVADSVSIATGSLHTNGLRAWIDDANPAAVVGNLGNIDRSAAGNKIWTGTVIDHGGVLTALSEDELLQGMDTVRERGGSVISDYVSNLKVIKQYHLSLKSDVFYALQAIKPLGDKVGIGRDAEAMRSGEKSEGETIYEFSGVPWRAEMFFDSNTVIGFNREHLFLGHGENEVPQPISEIFDNMTPFFTSTDNTTFEVVSYGQFELLSDDGGRSGVKHLDVAEA